MKYGMPLFKDLYVFHLYGVRSVLHNFGLIEQRLWDVMMFFAHEHLLDAKDHKISLETLSHYIVAKNQTLIINKLHGMKKEGDGPSIGHYFEDIKIVDSNVIYEYPSHLKILFSNKFELDFLKKLLSLKFESRYSIFLYRLSYMFSLLGYIKVIPVCSLRRFLDIEPHQYADPKYFFQKVLIKAMYEINEKTDLVISLKPIKEGKGIIAFYVHVHYKPGKKQDDVSIEELTNFVAHNLTFFKAFYLSKDPDVLLKSNVDCVDQYLSQEDKKFIKQLITEARKPKELTSSAEDFKQISLCKTNAKNCVPADW